MTVTTAGACPRRHRERWALAVVAGAAAWGIPLLGRALPAPPPAGCVAPAGTWCDATGPDCSANAGRMGATRCAERVTSQWRFNEGDFCRDCPYTFYVLVECGREMHLPVSDMEGMDLSVTNVVTGRAVPLRCVNETARADAGLGPYPTILQGNCDGVPGNERWWGPAFDETDNAGPGHVAWGFPGCDDVLGAYDADGDGAIACSEVPPDGGLLDRVSPGEGQVMDCWLADDAGLCGLYRVDVRSGGFEWDLFANCDGSGAPQFEIYFDCEEAWAAYQPLPELAVDALTVTGSCPDLVAEFTVRNIGCAPLLDDVTVAIATSCAIPDVTRRIVPGPFPPASAQRVSVPFTSSCRPTTVIVAVDPDDSVVECTESATVAACRAEAGVNFLEVDACGCAAAVAVDAGPDLVVCPGQPFTLTGSATGCASFEYRWIDAATSLPLTPFGPTADYLSPAPDCDASSGYVLEARCATGTPCSGTDTVSVTCDTYPPAMPSGDGSCTNPDRSAALSCGTPSATFLFMDWDTSDDADGDGDPANDHDVELACNVSHVYPSAGFYTMRVWYGNPDCPSWTETLVDVGVDPLVPQPAAASLCDGGTVTLDCGVAQPGTEYTWDLDTSVNSDGVGGSDDDTDATGCVVTAPHAAGSYTARSVATEELEPACTSFADVTFTVGGAAAGEVEGLRVTRAGPALTLRWLPLAGAAGYRVARGTIGTWYDHAADDAAGAGACAVAGTTLTDPDDAATDGGQRYYLVGGDCGGTVGPWGNAWNGRAFTARPNPIPTPTCP